MVTDGNLRQSLFDGGAHVVFRRAFAVAVTGVGVVICMDLHW